MKDNYSNARVEFSLVFVMLDMQLQYSERFMFQSNRYDHINKLIIEVAEQ